MESFAYIIALLLLGALLRRLSAPEDLAKSLNFFIIHVSLPATVLLKVPALHFDISALWIVLTPWLLLPPVIAVVLWMTRTQPPATRAALLLVLPLGNTSFVGIPVISTLIGEEAIGYVLMYDQFGTFLILSLYGSAIIARFESAPLHRGVLVQKVLLFPPLLALLAAFAIGELPPTLTPYVSQLADTLVPLALISVGFSMRLKGDFDRALFFKALGVKLLLMPLLAALLLYGTGSEPLALRTAVLESGMPPMITAGALAMASGFAPELAAALVGYGIILSLLTLPVLNWLLAFL